MNSKHLFLFISIIFLSSVYAQWCEDFEIAVGLATIAETRVTFYEGLTTEVDLIELPGDEEFVVTSGYTLGWRTDVPAGCFFNVTIDSIEMERFFSGTFSLSHLVSQCGFRLSLDTDEDSFYFDGTILTVIHTNCVSNTSDIEMPDKRFSQPVTIKIPRTLNIITDFLAEADLPDVTIEEEFAASLTLFEDPFITPIEDTPILNGSTIWGSVRLEELLAEDEGYANITCDQVFECSTRSVFQPPEINPGSGCSVATDNIYEDQLCLVIDDSVPADTSSCSRTISSAVMDDTLQHHFNFSTTAVIFPDTTAPVLYIHARCSVTFPEVTVTGRRLLDEEGTRTLTSYTTTFLKPIVIDDGWASKQMKAENAAQSKKDPKAPTRGTSTTRHQGDEHTSPEPVFVDHNQSSNKNSNLFGLTMSELVGVAGVLCMTMGTLIFFITKTLSKKAGAAYGEVAVNEP